MHDKTGRALNEPKKSKIIIGLHTNLSVLEIAKSIDRDHRAVKTFTINPDSCSQWKIATTKEVLESAGIPNVPKTTRFSIRKKLGNT